MGVTSTLNRLNMGPIAEKLSRYEAFLNNNAEELQTKHGIKMQERSIFGGAGQGNSAGG
jgi:hypothetical protein